MGTDNDLCTWSDLPRAMCACPPCTHRRAMAGLVAAKLGHTKPTTPATNSTPRRMRVIHPIAHQAPQPSVGARHMIDTPVDLIDYITALCDPTTHGEEYLTPLRNTDGTTTFIKQRHRTTSPPLLEQLWAAVEASGSTEGGQRSFESKPSARLDAADAATDIDKGVFGWLTKLDHRPDTMNDTIAALRHLGALAAGQDRDTHKVIESDVRSWWVRARVLTGWDSPAWKPNNTCPLCGVKGGLRVRLEHHTATCTECRETWSPETIGLLADHIRTENHEDEEQTG